MDVNEEAFIHYLQNSDESEIKYLFARNEREGSTKLTVFNQDGVYLGNVNMNAIAAGLADNKSIHLVKIYDTKIDIDGAIALGKALSVNTSIKNFICCEGSLVRDTVLPILKGMAQNTSVEELDLRRNIIQDAGALAIADMLTENTSIRELKLTDNEIGPSGIKAIVEALARNRNMALQELSMNWNKISDSGAKAIAHMLTSNTSLQDLEIGFGEIGIEGAVELGSAIKENNVLKGLHLDGNNIAREGSESLLDGIMENLSLEVVDFPDLDIDDEKFLRAMSQNTSLRTVYLNDANKKLGTRLKEVHLFHSSIDEAIQNNHTVYVNEDSGIFRNWKVGARKKGDTDNRLPLYKALEKGCSWDKVTKHILEAFPAAIFEEDDQGGSEGLLPIIVATTSPSSDFTSIYELLRYHPASIIPTTSELHRDRGLKRKYASS